MIDVALSARVIADFARHAGRAGIVAMLLMGAGAILEGTGLALLVPLLALLTRRTDGWPAQLVDRGFSAMGVEGQMPRLALVIAGFVVLMGVRAAVLIGRDRRVAMLQQAFVDRERMRVVTALAEARWPELARLRHARLVHALGVELGRIAGAITVLLQAAVATAMLVAQGIFAAVISPRMTAMGAVLLVAGLPVFATTLRREIAAGRMLSADGLSLTDLTVQMLGGLKAAIAQNMQAAFVAGFAETGRSAAARALAHQRQQSRAGIAFTTAVAVAAAILVLGGTWLGLEAVGMIASLFIFARMLAQLRILSRSARQFAIFLPAYKTFHDLLGDLATEPVARMPLSLTADATIRVDDVSYTYPVGDGGVRSISLAITRGEIIGLLGPSGSGKTTLVDLMAGMMEPDAGSITIGDRRLYRATASAWRDAISYVTQDSYLIDDTLRVNLTWGIAPREDAELWEVLRIAQAAEVVEGAPEGLDTRVAERGSRFSGGERQRLTIARALLRRPRLLILDEATSAIDIATEQQILVAVRDQPDRPTTLLVSHRRETLQVCDRLITLNGGRIVSDRALKPLP